MNKHRANFLLFISTTEIKERVNEIRNQINIPERIFSEISNKELGDIIENWIFEMADRCDEIEESYEFRKELTDIKEKLNKGEITNKQAAELKQELNLKLPINYLTHSINEIVIKYKLPKFYDFALRDYITTGRIQKRFCIK
jgi:cell shape-determining protein MreC